MATLPNDQWLDPLEAVRQGADCITFAEFIQFVRPERIPDFEAYRARQKSVLEHRYQQSKRFLEVATHIEWSADVKWVDSSDRIECRTECRPLVGKPIVPQGTEEEWVQGQRRHFPDVTKQLEEMATILIRRKLGLEPNPKEDLK